MEKKEIPEQELKNTAGGVLDYSKYTTAPNCSCYTLSGGVQKYVFLETEVYRCSDNAEFSCDGYINNNDRTTTWTFYNARNPAERMLFVSSPENQIIPGYYQ